MIGWPRIRAASSAALWMIVLAAAAASTAGAGRPNIVLMLADDQGWAGLSVPMHPQLAASRGEVFQTPCLQRFAAQGMRFSAAYAPAPVCSPTRISLQTGKSPARLHWTKAAPAEEGRRLLEPRLIKDIADEETTIGEVLRTAGYATAHYGKWHIGGGGPGRHGYDEHDGDTGNEEAFRFGDPNPVDIFGMADRAEAFMAKQSRAGKPFFVQLSWHALHAPENALRATLAKYGGQAAAADKRTATAAITEDLDSGVGRVLAALDRLGLAGETYVIYTSDNGAGGGRRGGLNGGKGSLWEGGIRVPFIVRGPGVAPNSWCQVPVLGSDLLPTFAAWAGVPAGTLPRGIEGGSLAGLLTGAAGARVERPREELVFHFPHYQGNEGPHSAIRLGTLKLLKFYEDDRVALYDLSTDISERDDLAGRMPADAKRLEDRLAGYLAAVSAQLPTPNPTFDPARSPAPRRRGGGKNRNATGNKP